MPKILITGAAGFIGSHLCEKLLMNNYSVIGLDNFDDFYSRSIKEKNIEAVKSHHNFKFIEADILSTSELKEKLDDDIELIIHLAAKAGVRPSILHPTEFIRTNISGTQNLLEWMKESSCKKLVFASSSSVYGNNQTPFCETDSVDHPISPYAFTKKSCELLNFNYHHLYQFSIVNLRFFTVYGPRQRPDLAIYKFFDKIYRDEIIEIYGDGSTGRDYTFVDDIVRGISLSMDYLNRQPAPIFEIFNIGNHSPVKLSELIDTIQSVTCKKIQTKNISMQEGDVNNTYADISKAKKLLGFSPEVSLRDGLEIFKRWFENK